MKKLPNEQQLVSSKDGSKWIPHLDGKPRTDISDWLHQNLTWDEFQAIVNPPKSTYELFTEEWEKRKNQYDKDILDLTLSMAGIILDDGVDEEAKKAELQALKRQTRTEYIADVATIRAKYYG